MSTVVRVPAAEAVSIAAVTPAIERWKAGVDTTDLDLIASAFTNDALFQGAWADPLSGRDGVRTYYGGQPDPLGVDYEITHLRPLADAAAVVFLDATFHPRGRVDRPTHITLVMEPIGGEWLISHYHVSFIG